MALDETAKDNSTRLSRQAIVQPAYSTQVNQLTSFQTEVVTYALPAIKYLDFHPSL